MDLESVIKGRRSIRRFKRKEVPDEMLEKILTSALWAPSAGNLQSRKFYVIKDKRLRDALAAYALYQNFISEAPVVIVVCVDMDIEWRYGERGKNLYAILDCGAAIQNILLTAYSLGLGTCWVGAFDEEGVRRLLKIPKNLRPISLIPLGFPDEEPTPPPRVSIKDACLFF